MSTEVVLTRIFSVVVWYHFAFFAISVALFGTGAAAVLVQLRLRTLEPRATDHVLAGAAMGLGGVIAIVDLLLVNVTPDWFSAQSQFTTLTGRLLLTFLLAAAPFFVGGLALSLALTRHALSAHRLYSWDLGGAALACIVVVPLLGLLGGPGALLFAGGLACASGAVFAWGIDPASRTKWVALAVVLSSLAVAGAVVGPRTGVLEVKVAKGVDLRRTAPEFNRWNAFSTVTVLPEVGFRGWGLSPAYTAPIPPQKRLVIDMNAMTTLTHFEGDLGSVQHALFDLSALVWGIRPGAGRVCIIGAGGGKDVLAALAGGARHVTAVEINPLIVDDVMRGRFRSFVGDLYGRPDVDVHVADGRSFVRATGRPFGVILLSMVDTSAATAAGAYALTENSLYTTDAFGDYLDKLEPGGVLSVSTASLEGLAVGARLATIARRVLRERGSDPARSVLVASTAWLAGPHAILYDVLVQPGGFAPADAMRFEELARQRGFAPVYVPGRPIPPLGPEQALIQQILAAPDDAALDAQLSALPLDVTPVDDERPFFFYQNRLADLPQALVAMGTSHLFGNGLVIVAKVILVALLVTLVFLVLPILARRGELTAGGGHAGWDAAYVACLGLGFMFVEIGALQRLSTYLGNPTYTLAVVLCVLLLAGAVGSRTFVRLSPTTMERRVTHVLLCVTAYGLVFALGARVVLDATATYSNEGRAAVAAGLLAPLGFFLGIPFPSGLYAVGRRAATRVPWLFSINSATSVLGSTLATLVALHGGIPMVLEAGALLYALAAAIWPRVVAAN